MDREERTVTSVNRANNDILLQTGKANVINLETSDNMECRILFGSGSHRSYITSIDSNGLNLSPLRKEKVLINTFGDMNTGVKEINVVQVTIGNKRGNECGSFELLVVPTICSPLLGQRTKAVKLKYEHLRDIYLSDLVGSTENCHVQILIGLDYYFSFMTGRCKRGKLGSPVALESSIGWILSGPAERCTQKIAAANVLIMQTMRVDVDDKNEMYDHFE